MKYLFSLFLGIILQASFAQSSEVELQIHPNWAGNAFNFSTVYSGGDCEYKITRLQYYVSEIKIKYDGGKSYLIKDLYFLVSAEKDTVLSLGILPVSNIEGIEFSIGVDQAANHLDPSTYPSSHPLALKNPSMHWGWTSGYRFIALEGNSNGGTGTTFNKNFQIHTVEDLNYRTVSFPVKAQLTQSGKSILHLNADYSNLLFKLSVKNGPISHASTGASATIINNMASNVFAVATPTDVNKIDESELRFFISGLRSNTISIDVHNPNVIAKEFNIMDLNGRLILSRKLNQEKENISFSSASIHGSLLLEMRSEQKTLLAKKIFIR